jgi:hypothetical protein
MKQPFALDALHESTRSIAGRPGRRTPEKRPLDGSDRNLDALKRDVKPEVILEEIARAEKELGR